MSEKALIDDRIASDVPICSTLDLNIWCDIDSLRGSSNIGNRSKSFGIRGQGELSKYIEDIAPDDIGRLQIEILQEILRD